MTSIPSARVGAARHRRWRACRNVVAPGTDEGAVRDERRRPRLPGRGQRHHAPPQQRGEPGRVGAEHLHHARHRGDGRARERGAHHRGDPVRQDGGELRQRPGPARGPPPAHRAEERADDGGARRSEGDGGADAARGVDGRRVRPRQVLPGRRVGRRLPRHRGDHRDPRQGPRSRPRARGLGGVAHDFAADEEELRAVRGAVEQGREGARLRRHGRDVAVEVRHAARRVHEGARSAVGAAASALSLAARLRAREDAREVRRPRTGRRPDPGAPARQHLGAGLEQHLRHRRAGRRRHARRR